MSIPDTFGDGKTYPVLIVVGSSTSNCTSEISCFEPELIEIELRDSIKWTTLDTVAHTVTSKTGLFDSGPLSPNNDRHDCYPFCKNSWEYRFVEYGTYDYSCKIHNWMQGTVIVTGRGHDAEVSQCGDLGCVFIDKYTNVSKAGVQAKIKIYGDITQRAEGGKVLLSITDPNGNVEKQKAVLNGTEWGLPVYVDDYGKYSVSVTLGSPGDVGIVEFEVVDLVKYNSPAEPEPTAPSIGPIGTITVELDSASYKQGDVIRISGSVNVSTNPLKAFAVTIKTEAPNGNLKDVAQRTPDRNGFYSWSIATGESWKHEGVYTVVVSYGSYNTTANFAFSIPEGTTTPTPTTPPSKIPTELTLGSIRSPIQLGENITISGTLWTYDGKPIHNAKILVYNGQSYQWSLNTGADGSFSGTSALNIVGAYQIFVVYGGSSDYESAHSTTHFVSVESVPNPPKVPPVTQQPDFDLNLILILVALSVIIGIVVVLMKQRKKTPKIAQVVQRPKKRRTTQRPPARPTPNVQSSADGPSTYGYFECPNCHEPSAPQGKLGQNPDGSQFCSKCGWKS